MNHNLTEETANERRESQIFVIFYQSSMCYAERQIYRRRHSYTGWIVKKELTLRAIMQILSIFDCLNVIPDARVRNIISKGLKYRFPSKIDFPKCRRGMNASLNDFNNRWCKRENVEPDALKEWNINIFKIIDTRISFYSCNTHLLPPKLKSSFRHLELGFQDFYMNYVLVPADKAANNVVVV